MVALKLPTRSRRTAGMVVMAVLFVLTACGGPASPGVAGPASPATAGPTVTAGPTATASTMASPTPPPYAGSFAELGYQMELPDGWVFGTERDVANAVESLKDVHPDWAARLEALIDESAPATSAFVAYNVGSDDGVTPGLSCLTLDRGSIPIDDALDMAEAQNLDAITDMPGLQGTPVADRTTLPVGPAVRIRWRTLAKEVDSSAIGYAFAVGPTLYTCVFTAGTSTVSRHEVEWEAILGTFRAEAAWSVAATIPVGVKPFLIAPGFGDLWVANMESGTVSRISPSANDVVAEIDLRAGRANGANEGPFGLAVGEGRVWATSMVVSPSGDLLPGIIWAIDPSTNAAEPVAEVGRGPMAAAVGFGSLWVVNQGDGSVSRIDPVTGVVGATIGVGAKPVAIATGAGSLWIANSGDGTLSRVDPATDRVTRTIPLSGNTPVAVASGERGIWVATETDLELVDPAGETVVATVDLPGIMGIAPDAGAIWAAEGMGMRVLQVDESAGEVVSEITIGTTSWGVAASGGSVWVVQPAAADKKWAEPAPGMVTRINP